MYPRFFFFLSGFGLLIVVRGIAVLGRTMTALLGPSPRLAHLAGASLVIVLMGCFAASLGVNYRYPKQDFQGAMAYVEAQREDGEPVVTVGVPATFCYQRYYNKPWQELCTVSQLAAIRGAGQAVWLIYAFPRYLDLAGGDLAAVIREQFTVMREFHGTLNGGDVIVCRTKLPSSGEPSP
jgi:hypothetical protein